MNRNEVKQPTKRKPYYKGEGTLDSNPFMSAKDKAKYLSSTSWSQLKAKRLEIAGYKCEFCGARNHLQLHHITYARLGKEKLSDLAILCSTHHNQLHEKLGKDRLTYYPLSALED